METLENKNWLLNQEKCQPISPSCIDLYRYERGILYNVWNVEHRRV